MLSSALITGFTLLNSLFGFAIQVILARIFGAGHSLDVYFYSLSYPTFLASIVVSLMSYSLIPKISSAKSSQEVSYIFSSVLYLALIGSLVCVLISPWMVDYLVALSGFKNASDFLRYLTYIAIVLSMLQVLQGIVIALLNSLMKPLIAVFLLSVPYLVGLSFLLFCNDISLVDISVTLCLGTLLSLVIGLLICRKYFTTDWSFGYAAQFMGRGAWVVIGLSCFSIYSIIDAYWASRSEDGTLTILSYSQRLLIAIGNIAVAAPSVLIIPKVSRMLASQSVDVVNFVVKRYSTFLIVNGLLWLSVYVTCPFIIDFVFSSEGFTDAAVADLQSTMRIMVFGAFFMISSVILFRLLYAISGLEIYGAILGLLWVLLYWSFISEMHLLGSDGFARGYTYSWVITFSFLLIVTGLGYRRKQMEFLNE